MRPAWSIIVFTSFSGFGLGLLFWFGLGFVVINELIDVILSPSSGSWRSRSVLCLRFCILGIRSVRGELYRSGVRLGYLAKAFVPWRPFFARSFTRGFGTSTVSVRQP